jgi:tryptophan synthase alpha chain
MNRIEKTFQDLKRAGRKATIFYVTSGFPSLRSTEQLILELQRQGTSIIEVGVPFSDPLADGPTIQNASVQALARGVHLGAIMQMVKKIRPKVHIPLVLFSYYNPIYHRGLKKFAQQAKRAGVDGVIIPDLPPEEGGPLGKALKQVQIPLIFLLSPTSSLKRIQLVGRQSRGFIYYVSRTGVTGVQKMLDRRLQAQVARVKKWARLPVVIGFGVSNASCAQRVARWSDGVVVGSALMAIVEKQNRKSRLKSKQNPLIKSAGSFVRKIIKAVGKVR